MNNPTTIKDYAGYSIIIENRSSIGDYRFSVKDKSDKVLLKSRRTYDSSDDAFVRACIRVNDEL